VTLFYLLIKRPRSGAGAAAERRRGRTARSSAGARGRAQQEALAVLLDLGLGEGFEIGDDGGPGGAGALVRGGEAVFKLRLQHEREEAAGDMAADRLIELVIDRPRLEQTLGRAERPLHGPQLFVDEHRLERREMRIGLEHEYAVELLVLLDLGAVDGKAAVMWFGEETPIALVADEALVAFLQLLFQRGDDGRARAYQFARGRPERREVLALRVRRSSRR